MRGLYPNGFASSKAVRDTGDDLYNAKKNLRKKETRIQKIIELEEEQDKCKKI